MLEILLSKGKRHNQDDMMSLGEQEILATKYEV